MTHPAADEAIKKLTLDGFAFRDLSVIGKGYHSEEQATGFFTTGDRMTLWGERGAFWGGLWGLFFGGVLLTVPVLGPVVVLGYLASTVVSAVEGAILIGGLGALSAAIVSMGFPKASVVKYEATLKSDGFIVMVHGDSDSISRARQILRATSPIDLETHSKVRFHEEESAIVL
jgi:hypothetical protein